MAKCIKKARDERKAAENAEIRLIQEQTALEDPSTKYRLEQIIEEDPTFMVESDDERENQLNN